IEQLKRYKVAPSPFVPAILGNLTGTLAAIAAGTATNWPGAGYDPELHNVYAPTGNTLSSRSLVEPPAGFSDIRYVSGTAGRAFRPVWGPGDCCAADSGRKTREELPTTVGTQPAPAPRAAAPSAPAPAGGGDEGGGLTVQGLPLTKPPYGMLSAINLDRGEIVFQVPHGDTPDNVRNHPLLRNLTLPKTGQAGTSGVGLLITKTL